VFCEFVSQLVTYGNVSLCCEAIRVCNIHITVISRNCLWLHLFNTIISLCHYNCQIQISYTNVWNQMCSCRCCFVARFLLFLGFARLATESDKNHPPIRWVLPVGMPARSLSGVFTLDWINRLSACYIMSASSSENCDPVSLLPFCIFYVLLVFSCTLYAFRGNRLPKAFCFGAVRVLVLPYVHVRSYMKSLWTWYLANRLLKEFHLMYGGAAGHKNELVRFWGQKVKVQGHDKTRYGQNHLYKTSVWWRHNDWWFPSKTM